MSDVLEALAGLRRCEQRTATRTSVVNLVVVAGNESEAALAADAGARMCGRAPGRTITVRCGAGDEQASRVDAAVALYEAESEGVAVWWEQVTLHVHGPVGAHLDSLVEPLILPDLPVAVWFVRGLPDAADPLVNAADAVVVDTRHAPGGDAFGTAAYLAARHPLVDLSWVRLGPWRALLAGLFEGATYRPFATCVRLARVAGNENPRRLLGGWLRSRLGLAPDAVSLSARRHVSIELEAERDGRRAAFSVAREEGERLVRASAEVEGGPSHTDVVSLPDDSLPWSLAEALTRLQRDPVYEAALRAALDTPPGAVASASTPS